MAFSLFSCLKPSIVIPGIAIQPPDNRGGFGPDLGKKLEGVRLFEQCVLLGFDFELVWLALTDVREKQLPDAGLAQNPHLMDPAVPVIEVAQDADPLGAWRPDAEDCPV